MQYSSYVIFKDTRWNEMEWNERMPAISLSRNQWLALCPMIDRRCISA